MYWNGTSSKKQHVISSCVDFTPGQTGLIKSYKEQGPHIFFLFAWNWECVVLPGMVVTTQVLFYIHSEREGTFKNLSL